MVCPILDFFVCCWFGLVDWFWDIVQPVLPCGSCCGRFFVVRFKPTHRVYAAFLERLGNVRAHLRHW